MLEIIISVSILGIMLAVILPSLANFRNSQTMANTTSDIIALLNEARAKTLSSENSTYYSVHFESSRVVLFTGGTFDDSNTSNKVVTLSSIVTIPSSGGINLAGSGVNVSFDRLTGDTNQYGTIVIQLISDPTTQKTITINKTGVISSN